MVVMAHAHTAEAVALNTMILYPPVLFLVFALSAGIHSVRAARAREELVSSDATGPGGHGLPLKTRQRARSAASVVPEFSKTIRYIFYCASFLVVLSFLTNIIVILVHVVGTASQDGWWSGDEIAVYVLGGCALHLYVLISFLEGDNSPSVVQLIFWILSLAGEGIIFVSSLLRTHGPHRALKNAALSIWVVTEGPDQWDYIDMGLGLVRMFLLAFLVILYLILSMRQSIKLREKLEEESRAVEADEADEETPLLRSSGRSYSPREGAGHERRRRHSQGAAANRGYQSKDEEAAFYRPEKLPHKTWWEYLRGYSLFFPYLWPSKSSKLKTIILICFKILILQRVVNFLVPNQIGVVTDALRDAVADNSRRVPWVEILLLIFYKLLQGSSGWLGSARALLWIPVSQYCYRALTTAAFEHVHSLSLDFHLGKRTGEVLSALNKGASINSFLEQITFQVTPMLVDLLVAVAFFYFKFGAIYATLASIVSVYYLHMTVRMATSRSDLRRDMVNADREEEAVKNDSIVSYETVKYFNAEAREFERYRNAIKAFQVAEAKVTWGMNNMNICQSLVFMLGVLAVLMVGAFEVTQGSRTVGDFMVMITYLTQLQGPLNFFGTFYRTIQQAMISGERLLELFKIKPTVVDREGVQPLTTNHGHIRWSNVNFSYDKRRPALEGLSFECVPGTTTAFVGESGGGKSTIFRLMFRYFNCQSGTIEIDGNDVKDVTIDSVRRMIGVVPQDTILFNESIMYNLKYANPDVSEAEVIEACKAASIHDRISSFPDGYDSKVGDRGLLLSGGEKQRVAIARTMLKKPRIIMLDEATSALDSETEQQIQKKLIRGEGLGQDHTLLIIAHRLSTITHADQILVLHAGAIVERGTHSELLAMKGRYTSMWEKQSQAEAAAEKARDATAKANKLLRQAHIDVAPTPLGGEDVSDGYNSMSSSTFLQTGPTTPGAGSTKSDSSSSSDEDDDDDDEARPKELRGD